MKNSTFLLFISLMPIVGMSLLSSGLFSKTGFSFERFWPAGILIAFVTLCFVLLRRMEKKTK